MADFAFLWSRGPVTGGGDSSRQKQRTRCTRQVTRCSAAVGLDFGTSSARAAVIRTNGGDSEVVFETEVPWSNEEDLVGVRDWIRALLTLVERIPGSLREETTAIGLDGTSATSVLLPSLAVRRYDYAVMDEDAVDLVRRSAPEGHTTTAPTSSLCKLVSWAMHEDMRNTARFAHQADVLVCALLHGICAHDDPELGHKLGTARLTSDWHNALKLGFDPAAEVYPSWMKALLDPIAPDAFGQWLPQVARPGEILGPPKGKFGELFPNPSCGVAAATTDSIAAFYGATGTVAGLRPGDACTSLGSTLALKMLSEKRVEDSRFGVYSHRHPVDKNVTEAPQWLVGGASNVGCRIFRDLSYSTEELRDLSKRMNSDEDTALRYYALPLGRKGERFPSCDPAKECQLDPRAPEVSRGLMLQGLFESIARTERDGYAKVGALGAAPAYPSRLWTSGGGAQNPVWTRIRRRTIFGNNSHDMHQPFSPSASVGAALLASGLPAPALNCRRS